MFPQVTNLPTPYDSEAIQCTMDARGNFVVRTESGALICELSGKSSNALSKDLAAIITAVRNQAFEQGRQHIRKALGF